MINKVHKIALYSFQDLPHTASTERKNITFPNSKRIEKIYKQSRIEIRKQTIPEIGNSNLEIKMTVRRGNRNLNKISFS